MDSRKEMIGQTLAVSPADARVLCISTTDVMPWIFLRPWFRSLQEAGYEVHVACPRGTYFEALRAEGFQMHEVALRRTFNPFAHVRPLYQLVRLLRRVHFVLVNAHSPVAGAVGRLAASLAGAKPRIYAVHGFYFHDRMARAWRWLFIGIEWLLGRLTDHFMFVSEEDRRTALRLGIAKEESQTTTIWDGVDLTSFRPVASLAEQRATKMDLGLNPDRVVVGIVGRIVREKGYREFLGMAEALIKMDRDVTFLVIGDTLASDRDQFGAAFRGLVSEAGLGDQFVFAGFTEQVFRYLRAMDVFVLPSYREGFPRSVIEAMATGLPVVATNVRGCREAVVHKETGFLVPVRDIRALTEAVLYLVDRPDEARRMGAAGRRRAEALYDQRLVRERVVGVVDRLLGKRCVGAQLPTNGNS